MRSNLMRYAMPALEEISNGKANDELEHTFYAQLTDFEQLKKAATIEQQEQWNLKIPKVAGFNALAGAIRIRKTTVSGVSEYVMTTKVDGAANGRRIEVPIPTTEDNFTQFRFLAGDGMIKDRHTFPVEGTDLVWEVDVYPKEDGSYHEWVKIDLEVKDLETPVPALPVSVNMHTLITRPSKQFTQEERRQVEHLYDTVFLTKNRYLSEALKQTTRAQAMPENLRVPTTDPASGVQEP